MQSNSNRVVVLATGGTIAGAAASATEVLNYRAAELGVEALLAAVPALAQWPLEAHQLAQVDSKDMEHAVWQRLAEAARAHLARPEVAGLVITHGTDTLEETAWFLHRVLAPEKPVVLTAAMRPATALSADGPQNLLDAVTLASWPGARGVMAAMAGRAHGALDVRKLHGFELDAFSSGDAGPVAHIRQGLVRQLRAWPSLSLNERGAARPEGEEPPWIEALERPVEAWPRVDILVSHAGCDGALVAAAVALGARGLVLEGTGNGTVHHRIEEAARAAMHEGVVVWRTTRCLLGGVEGGAEAGVERGMAPGQGSLVSAGALTPAKARVELMLSLMR